MAATHLNASNALLEFLDTNARIGCLVCGKHQDLQSCDHCHTAFYCSDAHQRLGWVSHSHECLESKEERERMASFLPMDEKRVQLLRREINLLGTLLSSPSIDPAGILSLATRRKLLCQEIIQWPHHREFWPNAYDHIACYFIYYAKAFVDAKLSDSPQACRNTVGLVERHLKVYRRTIPGDPKIRFEDGLLQELMGRIEAHVGDHQGALGLFDRASNVYESLLANQTASIRFRVDHSAETHAHGRVLYCMMTSANALKSHNLVDKFFERFCDRFSGNERALLPVRLNYAAMITVRTASIRESLQPPQWESDLRVQYNDAIVSNVLSLAIDEAKVLDDFLLWSVAMGLCLKYNYLSGPGHKAAADRCASLILHMHLCHRQDKPLCSAARAAKEILCSTRSVVLNLDEISRLGGPCCREPVELEWIRYRLG
ncbi:hypothetical protein HDU98_003160 [Podochytrium sp. JEL0797]|nr:hypothetical protein HDU98_003160 [Podochytrium sp. JEL0797]